MRVLVIGVEHAGAASIIARGLQKEGLQTSLLKPPKFPFAYMTFIKKLYGTDIVFAVHLGDSYRLVFLTKLFSHACMLSPEEAETPWKDTLAICFFNLLLAKPKEKATLPRGPRIKIRKRNIPKRNLQKRERHQKIKNTLHTLVKPSKNPARITIQNIFGSK